MSSGTALRSTSDRWAASKRGNWWEPASRSTSSCSPRRSCNASRPKAGSPRRHQGLRAIGDRDRGQSRLAAASGRERRGRPEGHAADVDRPAGWPLPSAGDFAAAASAASWAACFSCSSAPTLAKPRRNAPSYRRKARGAEGGGSRGTTGSRNSKSRPLSQSCGRLAGCAMLSPDFSSARSRTRANRL